MMGSGDSTFHWVRDIGVFFGGILAMTLAGLLGVDYYLLSRLRKRRRRGSSPTTSRVHLPE
jgi:hypothetical protein